jgi:hypothetical protein
MLRPLLIPSGIGAFIRIICVEDKVLRYLLVVALKYVHFLWLNSIPFHGCCLLGLEYDLRLAMHLWHLINRVPTLHLAGGVSHVPLHPGTLLIFHESCLITVIHHHGIELMRYLTYALC